MYQLGAGTVTSSSMSTASSKTSVGTSSTSKTSTSTAPTTSSTGWVYQGCYVDGLNGRDMSFQQPDSQTNTVESCINTCAGLGYTIAGMEYSVGLVSELNLLLLKVPEDTELLPTFRIVRLIMEDVP